MPFRRFLSTFTVAAIVLALGAPTLRAAEKGLATVAHIKFHGDLDESPVAEDPLFGTSAESFKTKLERIKKAKDDANIQGLYLEIDGLGIGYAKVDELCHAIGEFRKAGKKV